MHQELSTPILWNFELERFCNISPCFLCLGFQLTRRELQDRMQGPLCSFNLIAQRRVCAPRKATAGFVIDDDETTENLLLPHHRLLAAA